MDNIEKIIEEKTHKILLNIKAIRESKKISRAKLADKIGVSKDSIYLLEKGERSLSLKWIILFSENLNCSIAQLLGEDVTENTNNSKNNQNTKQYMVAEYMNDAMIILQKIELVKDLKDSDKSALIGEIYKRIYDIYEQKLNKNQMINLLNNIRMDSIIGGVIVDFLEKKIN